MPEAPDRPNLLFIFTDQQRADTMRAYGNTWIRTPNLDHLAGTGFVFEHAYVSSPICTPSRSTIITGLWPHTNGAYKNNILLPQEVDTVADFLPDNYHVAYYGKWHLGDEVIKRRGWDEWHSIEDQYRVWHTKPAYNEVLSDYHHYLVSQGYRPDAKSRGKAVFSRYFASELPEEHTKAVYLGNRVAEFIHRNRERPFALYVNMLEPHPPYNGPYNGMYDPASLPQAPTFLKPPPENASGMARLMAEAQRKRSDAAAPGPREELGRDPAPEQTRGEGPESMDEESCREVQARYYGLVSLADKAVGMMLQALEDAGVADRTIVVFTSEHGDQMGEHGMFHKLVMYEQTIAVPMLVRVPWLGMGRVPGRYSHIDTVPTLLDLMGVQAPPHLQGRSRADVLRGAATLQGNDVVIDWNGRSVDLKFPLSQLERVRELPHRCLVSADGWKLTLADGDHCELYDLNGDPHETVNLFNDPAHSARVVDMAKRLRKWQVETGDATPLPDVFPGAGFVPEMR